MLLDFLWFNFGGNKNIFDMMKFCTFCRGYIHVKLDIV